MRLFTFTKKSPARQQMSMTSDWTPDPVEVAYLAKYGRGAARKRERNAILAIGYRDGIDPWKIGQAAGMSPGQTKDPEQRRVNLASATSKAARKGGEPLPHIEDLQDKLDRFRAGAEGEDGPNKMTDAEMRAELEWIARKGAPQEKMRAIELLRKADGSGLGDIDPKAVIAEVVRRIGRDKAKWLFYAAAPNLLPMVDEMDCGLSAEILQAINTAKSFADFERRKDELEAAAA